MGAGIYFESDDALVDLRRETTPNLMGDNIRFAAGGSVSMDTNFIYCSLRNVTTIIITAAATISAVM